MFSFQFISSLRSLAIAALFGCATAVNLDAASLTIGRTPILSATVPTNTTYQVEFSTNGTTWAGTGVLLGGTGIPSTNRLDGFPTNGSYRLSAIGVGSTINPAITHGFHLTAIFPGANEVRIESTNQLNSGAWTHRGFVFTNLQGGFLFPVRPPLETNAFFRALQPTLSLVSAIISSYPPDTNNTSAGYGLVADDMPQLYRDGFIAALCPTSYHRGGSNSVAAGECYELAGPLGKTTVMIADIASVPPSGTCDFNNPYFDIGTPAFTNLTKEGTGFGTATYRLVPAPTTGNVKLVCIYNSGGYYVELRPYNHRAGVSKLEVQTGGGSWTELSRTEYNSFVYSFGTPLASPFNVRVTSRFGEVVTFPSISPTEGSRHTANAQFTVFPDQGPSPVWIQSPVYTDSFTNMLGAQWGTSTYFGPSLDPSYSGNVYQGAHSLRVTNFNGFGTINFISPVVFSRQPDSYLEFAIRSEGASISTLRIQFDGSNAGVSAQSAPVTLPTIDNTWQVFRIPLVAASAPTQISQFELINSSSSNLPPVDLDSIAIRW